MGFYKPVLRLVIAVNGQPNSRRVHKSSPDPPSQKAGLMGQEVQGAASSSSRNK